jgi:hypothetical protein
MITIDNYFNTIPSINFSELPEALRKGHEFILKGSKNGASWTFYSSSPVIKKMVDTYLSKLNDYLSKSGKAERKQKKATAERKQHDDIIKDAMIRQGLIDKDGNKIDKPIKKTKASKNVFQPHLVERIPEELRYIRRFVNLNGKTKTKDEVLSFINSLQKAIVERRIRKTSGLAEEIVFIQDKLISVYNTMKSKIRLELKPETLDKYKELVKEERIRPSVSFIKRYISINGKIGMKEQAKQLLTQINRAMDKGRITDNDPYITEIHELKKNLKEFTTAKGIKVLEIEQATLNGLEGILGCACQNLNGIESKPAIMNSMDFADLEFDTLGFTGKWLKLIGDPSTNFTAMVFGKPKMGKSYLCIEFAGHLARNHGKVLYVAKEEGLDYTLQQKLNDKDVVHPNLFVASVLPNDLSQYDFIFLDSVNKLGLTPEDLNQLKKSNPTKSFIFIFQSTKDGKFRGANTFQHDVDVVIEVPEKGKAVQMGRFNQGGEINIFENSLPTAAWCPLLD